jgi:hypothetical protein
MRWYQLSSAPELSYCSGIGQTTSSLKATKYFREELEALYLLFAGSYGRILAHPPPSSLLSLRSAKHLLRMRQKNPAKDDEFLYFQPYISAR